MHSVDPSSSRFPLLLVPIGTVIPTRDSHRSTTCQCHSSLLSWIFLDSFVTFMLPFIFSFLFLSNLLTLHVHLSILTSSAPSFLHCNLHLSKRIFLPANYKVINEKIKFMLCKQLHHLSGTLLQKIFS